MNFNKHLNLEGQHAFLGASKYHWVNYDEEKLILSFSKFQAAQRGTELHELANKCIKLGIKLPKTKNALNLFVNDAIGFRMETEQVLYYSDNCFGTTDAISFRKNVLRISDLKNGETVSSIKQLVIYAALFCLEYSFKPDEIERIELRIYQFDDILIHIPQSEEILQVMEKIVLFDRKIEQLKGE